MFGYLFERFPSFTQTFCAREVAALRGHGVEAPVFSIRNPDEEPIHQAFPNLGETTYLPDSFEDRIKNDASFRRAARRGVKQLVAEWGDCSEKRRIYEALWLAPELRRQGIWHIHAHFAGMAARTAFWLHRLAGVRFSFTAHANDVFCDEHEDRLTQMIASAEFVATETEFSRQFLLERHPAHADKIYRVFNGIPLKPLNRHAPTPPPLIMSVGRYIEKKGFIDLIDACCQMTDLDFECHIVGQGPLEDTLKTRASAALGKVVIIGPQTQQQIEAALAKASVFVLPCVYAADGGSDNLPTVIMEAMAAGLPVISTRVAGIPEMVIDGETGYMVPEHDPAALADKLISLLQNPAAAQKMGLAARLRCEQLFGAESVATEFKGILEKHGAFSPDRRLKWWERLLGR